MPAAPPRRVVGLLSVILLLLGPACASAGPPAAPVAGVSTIDRADLALARSIWATAGSAAYVLEAETPEAGGTLVATVEVAAGRVRSAHGPDGRPVAGDLASLTVERLFALVEEGLEGVEAGRVARLEVMFDGHHGLPLDVLVVERGGATRRLIIRRYHPGLL